MGTLVAVRSEEISALLRRSANVPSNGPLEELADPAELMARLEEGEQVDAVVLGSDLEEPVRVAQRIHSIDKEVAVLILSEPGRCDQLTQALRFAPLLGEDVGCVSIAQPETVVGEAKEAVARVRKRRSYRATIAAASADVAALSLPQPRAEQYLDRLLDRAPIGVAAVDERGMVLAWNRKAGDILGKSEREVLGTPLTYLFPEGEREKLGSLITGCFTSEDYSSPEILQRETTKGRPQFLETTAAALAERAGARGAMVLIQDVTERKQVEEALKESEERFRVLAEEAVEGIVLTEDGKIIDANPTYTRMFGYKLQELIGMDVVELSPPDLREEVGRRISTQDTNPYEARGLKKDGTIFPIEVRPRHIPYYGRQVRITSVIDLSERRRAEEAMAEVREAERTRLARDLHDGVLQDLSYATAAMGLIIMRDAEGTALEEELQKVIDVIRSAVQGLRSAVNDLRLADELDQPFPRLVESLVERNREMARGRQIGLKVKEGFPSEPLGEAGTQLLRILQEALTNVRRHSVARNVLVSLRAEGNDLVAEVADDGRGFEPDTAPGVGLRSMQERATSLGGELAIESEPGKGTRVRLRVPIPGGG